MANRKAKNMKLSKRPLHNFTPSIAVLSRYCELLDRTLPRLRTLLLAAGLAAAALKAGPLADYLFSAGLLLHWAIWFQGWWTGARSRR